MKQFLTMSFMVLGIIFGASAQNRSINFIEGKTFEEIKELAKKENKMIFMDFYTTWCGPCKKMDKEVYTNDSVADFYNSKFVCMKIDAEKGEGVELRKKYEIQVYPSLIFISSEGKMIHRDAGFKISPEFIKLGVNAYTPEKQISKSIDEYEKGNKDSESILQLIDSMRSVRMPVGKFVSEYLATQKDSALFSKINWQLINLYITDIDSREFKFLLNNYEKFCVSHGDSAVSKKIAKTFTYKVFAIGRSRDKDKAKQFSDLEILIKKYHFSDEKNMLTALSLNYHYGAENWQKFSEICVSGIVEDYYWDKATSLNMLATAFYEHIKDPSMLEKALKWSLHSVELEDSAENNAIYARLLLRLGQKDKAIEVELHAIDLAIKDGLIDAKDRDNLLAEFKKRKK